MSITPQDLTLKVICSELGPIKTKSHQIGIQLGIPRNKLQELKKDDDPLSAIVDYWLQGNVPESVSTISWKSIVEALKSQYVGEPGLAEKISNKYCQQHDEIPHGSLATDGDSSATSDTAANTSSHDGSKLHPDVRMDLDFILRKNIKGIIYQYGSYVDCLCDSVIEKGVTPEKLRTYLLSIFATSKTCTGQKLALLSDKKEELEKCTTINAIFDVLTTQCASFLNYEIFQGILKNFGINEDFERLKYSEYLEAYVKKHTILEFTKVNPLLKRRKSSKEFIAKFDVETTCRLAKVTELKIIIAEILDINPSALEIVDIEDGCVVVKFLIPESLADSIFPPNTVLTSQQEDDLRAAKVLWLKCNGQTFYFEQKITCSETKVNTLEQLKDEFIINCSVCLDTYTNPKQLQCFHVFCQQCLDKLVVQDPQGQFILTCPECHQVTPVPARGVAGLRPAFFVNHFLEIVKEHRKTEANTEKEKGAIESSSVICSEHRTEADLYCENCVQLICFKCIIKDGKHANHNYDKVEKAFERYKMEITSSLSPMEKQLVIIKKALGQLDAHSDEITNQHATLEANIHHTIRNLQLTLEVRKTELTGQLHKLTQAKLKSLAAQKDLLKTTQAQLSSCLFFLRENLKTGNQGEALKMKSIKVKQVNDLTTTFQPDMLEPNTEADMMFLELKDLSAECRQYGIVCEENLPDPSQCLITAGKGADTATAGVRYTLNLQTLNYKSQPCKALTSCISCELVSEITGTKASCYVKNKRESQYEITYQPTIKGKHQLCIKVESQHIRGSPFPVNVTSGVKNLGTPIQTIRGMKKPLGVAVNQRGEVVVTEYYEHCVSVFSPSGEKLQSFGKCGSNEGEFDSPYGVAVDGEENILVADRLNHRIQKFTVHGKFLAEVGTKGTEPFQFSYPCGVAVSPSNGRVYVADTENHRIQILSSDFAYTGIIGKRGTGKGQFVKPCNIACDSTGNVYVVDNSRIQVFTTNGKFLRKLDGDRRYIQIPHGLAIDSFDRVYISNSHSGVHNISVFTPKGEFLTSFGDEKERSADVNDPKHLRGLAVDSNGVVYVCDHGNDCVLLF